MMLCGPRRRRRAAPLLLLLLLLLLPAALGVDRGLNLPPTQGTTRDGAFFPGVYSYEYRPEQVATAFGDAGFGAVRLAVNVESAGDPSFLRKLKGYIDAAGGHGLICMFDTSSQAGAPVPRTARINDFGVFVQAWRRIHEVFAPYGDRVRYELFNEPSGYQSNAEWYVHDMLRVIHEAQLPPERCVLAGLYGSADILAVARAGWTGYLALHWYTFYLPEGQRTPEAFSARIQQSMQGVSNRVFITEFGTGLDDLDVDVDADEVKWDVAKHVNHVTLTSDWQDETQQNESKLEQMCVAHPGHILCRARRNRNLGAKSLESPSRSLAQVARRGLETPRLAPNQADTLSFLRGFRDALAAVKRQGAGVMGIYHWHGWHNGDTWDFWDAANAQSSRMIQLIMADLAEAAAPKEGGAAEESDAWALDFVHDDQQVHMAILRDKGPAAEAACPAACAADVCAPGNELQIGGKHLTAGHCTHVCSVPYDGTRYCGAGRQYLGAGAVDCGACARPLMCAGLPCWSAATAAASGAAAVQAKERAASLRGARVHAGQES